MGGVYILLLLTPIMATQYEVDPSVATIGDISTVSNFANDVLAFVDGRVPLEELMKNDIDSAFSAIAKKMGELSAQLEEMEATTEQKMDNMLTTLMNRLSATDRQTIGLSALHDYTFCVDCMYDVYTKYLESPENFRNENISSFIKVMLSDGTEDLPHILIDECRPCTENLHHFSAENRESIEELLNKKNHDMSFGELCGTSSSAQQRLFEIYRTILISEAREYVMKIFSYAIRTVDKEASFDTKMKELSSEFVAKSQKYLIGTRKAMEHSSLAVDLCDPHVFDRGVNYIELEGAIQMFIANEINLSPDDSNVCSKECSDYKDSTHLITLPKRRNKNNWYPIKSCNGQLLDCVSGSSSRVCEMMDDSLDRYEWVEDGYNNTYGDSSSCSGRLKYPEPYKLHDHVCDICICTCIDETEGSPAIRNINLRPALSDIKENRVVTGIRFALSDNIVQMQIEEGELLAGGCITENSEKWVDLETFSSDENDVFDTPTNGAIYLLEGEEEILLEQDIDFASITSQRRTISLDKLMAPPDHVITGVKLQYKKKLEEQVGEPPLQLAIRVTKFNFTSGALHQDDKSSYWVSNDEELGSEIDLTGADRPTKLRGHVQISNPGQYIRFTASDRNKDAGRSTIPFFDVQGVTTSISTPLNGIQLLHRGAPSSGGFLAFRLLTLDISQYINTELAP